ncbi:MAG TPA: hypothetical protein VLW83_12215, partial [Candidatus Acidoferrales bacterium]|nr:hypothetical protein [Candidatus Acidoferrales bacterium]
MMPRRARDIEQGTGAGPGPGREDPRYYLVTHPWQAAYEPPRPFQDHDVRPRIANGLSMDRLAHRVASVTSVRPNSRRAQMARLRR